MGYALLRGVMGKGTMIENNINQTIASGINTAGTGVVFTPALFMLDAKWRAEGLPGLEFSMGPLLLGGGWCGTRRCFDHPAKKANDRPRPAAVSIGDCRRNDYSFWKHRA